MSVKHHLSFHETELEKVDTETEAEREKNEAIHEERYDFIFTLIEICLLV